MPKKTLQNEKDKTTNLRKVYNLDLVALEMQTCQLRQIALNFFFFNYAISFYAFYISIGTIQKIVL